MAGALGGDRWGLARAKTHGPGPWSRSTPGTFHTQPRTARARAGQPVTEWALLAQDSPLALPTARPHLLCRARPLPGQANAPRPWAALLAKATDPGSLTTARVVSRGRGWWPGPEQPVPGLAAGLPSLRPLRLGLSGLAAEALLGRKACGGLWPPRLSLLLSLPPLCSLPPMFSATPRVKPWVPWPPPESHFAFPPATDAAGAE